MPKTKALLSDEQIRQIQEGRNRLAAEEYEEEEIHLEVRHDFHGLKPLAIQAIRDSLTGQSKCAKCGFAGLAPDKVRLSAAIATLDRTGFAAAKRIEVKNASVKDQQTEEELAQRALKSMLSLDAITLSHIINGLLDQRPDVAHLIKLEPQVLIETSAMPLLVDKNE